jgi:hypothetical protein
VLTSRYVSGGLPAPGKEIVPIPREIYELRVSERVPWDHEGHMTQIVTNDSDICIGFVCPT